MTGMDANVLAQAMEDTFDGDEVVREWADAVRTLGAQIVVERYGRVIAVEVGEKVDECCQFRVALTVDGKERYVCFVTDKSDNV